MFVATKASTLKKNAESNFESVTFRKKVKKEPSTDKGIVRSARPEKAPKKNEAPDMKKLRYEIIKFGTSGFSGELKKDANIALMVSLGAEPPKNRRRNYKKMLEDKKKKEKTRNELDDKYKAFQSKSKQKPHQNIKKRKKKDVKGLLDVYGEVKKGKKSGKRN